MLLSSTDTHLLHHELRLIPQHGVPQGPEKGRCEARQLVAVNAAVAIHVDQVEELHDLAYPLLPKAICRVVRRRLVLVLVRLGIYIELHNWLGLHRSAAALGHHAALLLHQRLDPNAFPLVILAVLHLDLIPTA